MSDVKTRLENRIRYRIELGRTAKEIIAELGCDPKIVHSCDKRFGKRKYKNTTGHRVHSVWRDRENKSRPVETGKCVYFIPSEGKVCGAKCKGQRCEDHPQTVARTINIGARTGGGIAA